MTLTVCLKGKDGMVLASDSRGTFGDPRRVTAQNDNMKKLYAVSKYVGVSARAKFQRQFDSASALSFFELLAINRV